MGVNIIPFDRRYIFPLLRLYVFILAYLQLDISKFHNLTRSHQELYETSKKYATPEVPLHHQLLRETTFQNHNMLHMHKFHSRDQKSLKGDKKKENN